MSKKSLEEFIFLFIAVCKDNGSNHLNLDLFKEYIYLMLSKELYDVPNHFILVDEKVNLTIKYMIKEGLIKRIEGFNYLIAITNMNNLKEIIDDEVEIEKMNKIYEEYINFAFKDERELYRIISQQDGYEKKLSL